PKQGSRIRRTPDQTCRLRHARIHSLSPEVRGDFLLKFKSSVIGHPHPSSSAPTFRWQRTNFPRCGPAVWGANQIQTKKQRPFLVEFPLLIATSEDTPGCALSFAHDILVSLEQPQLRRHVF